ncbi:tetratricopeptide repeat protein [Niabella aurantiaca]|uniref:tetratricopeptide repeat protein n=1 Tax=Niabella aurantiaca TaxID=379900 RepID=UPI00037511DB|nr:tetratricopeptide repeat protein [Niabella aurantiaca]
MINKKIRLLALTVILGVAVNAQSIQDGVKALYSGKVLGAKSIFEKQGDKPEAIYWLVRADIENQDKAGAQQVLDKALAANPNDEWLLVAKGQLQLINGKANEAKQSFEAALTASKRRKGNDPEILNAVGAAIAKEYNNIDKIGDINYAVQKLEEAKAETEKAKDHWFRADILTNLGDAYRKAKPGDGTAAFSSYRDAVDIEPSFAKAYLRNALIFKSQRNYELYQQNIDKAIAANPAFVPAYENLYWYKMGTGDFNGANAIADKIIANSDPSPWNDYYKAQTFYLNKQYDQAIASATGIQQKMGDLAKPNLYKLLAWAYVDKGDAKAALPYMEKYFAKVDKEDMDPMDYNLKATVYAATPGKENEVMQAYEEGLKADTTTAGRIKMLQEGAKFFADKKQYALQGDLLSKILEIKPNPTINDFFDAGYRAYYQGKEYEKSWKVFDAMRTKFPDVNYGYLWAFNNSRIFDSANAKNIMIPDAEKLVAFSLKDTARDAKSNAFSAAAVLFPYFVNEKGDKETGLKYLNVALQNAPNDDVKQQVQGLIEQVSKMAAKPAGTEESNNQAGGAATGAKDTTSTAPKKDTASGGSQK